MPTSHLDISFRWQLSFKQFIELAKYKYHIIAVAPPIYPDKEKNKGENVEMMMKKNYDVWKEIYEKTYGIPLTYTCEE